MNVEIQFIKGKPYVALNDVIALITGVQGSIVMNQAHAAQVPGSSVLIGGGGGAQPGFEPVSAIGGCGGSAQPGFDARSQTRCVDPEPNIPVGISGAQLQAHQGTNANIDPVMKDIRPLR